MSNQKTSRKMICKKCGLEIPQQATHNCGATSLITEKTFTVERTFGPLLPIDYQEFVKNEFEKVWVVLNRHTKELENLRERAKA